MGRDISRRDFLNGMSLAIGGSLIPGMALGAEFKTDYPPALLGMRGSHPGSFEAAHMAVRGMRWSARESEERYDLVVIGGGISGLSAAYFYRQRMPSAHILILDNHDDFGGHAKRNEFTIDGRLLLGYGGTQSIEAPGGYPEVAKTLIRELGIETDRFYEAFDSDLYNSLGLTSATFFDRETFGSDHLAVGDLTDQAVLQHVPLSDRGKADIARLLIDEEHYLQDLDREQRLDYLAQTDYRTYLRECAGLGEEALDFMQARSSSAWAISIDGLPAQAAWSSGFPGFGDLDLGIYSYRREEDEPYIFHFPDGNASIARLLVRNLVPAVASGSTMEDVVLDRFDYSKLDSEDAGVRIRLNSTAIRVRHVEDDLAKPVAVTYLNGSEAQTVTANRVVLACYHSMVPWLCPEMPESQLAAMTNSLRAPLVYTNVLIRNWSSFQELGMQRVYCPGSYHHGITLDFPVSLGGYRFPADPQEPMVLHLTRTPGGPGLTASEQFAAGKRELLETPFETFETNIRDQLGRVLAGGGFDADRDIAGITVNRWPHGYAYGYDPASDQVAFEPGRWPKEKQHWVTARQPFGNISVAAIDSASNAMTEAAIEQAHRAVDDLL